MSRFRLTLRSEKDRQNTGVHKNAESFITTETALTLEL